MLTMIERFLRYLLARFYPEPPKKWTRVEVIELARQARIILPTEKAAPEPQPDNLPLAMAQQHRGRAYQGDPNGQSLKQPPDLRRIMEDIKSLGLPFLLVVLKTGMSGATHGWCNGSNWGRVCLEELARCAELNFKQELEKCPMSGGPVYEKHLPGQGYLK